MGRHVRYKRTMRSRLKGTLSSHLNSLQHNYYNYNTHTNNSKTNPTNTTKMKFSAATLLAAAASVSATAVFEVKDFTASCIAHSTFCDYQFKVIQPHSMETWENAVVCNARAQSTDYTLPDIKDGKCKDSSRTFTVTRGDKGLLVKISQPVSPKSNTVGEHFIPKSLLFQSEVPNAEVQMYNGPKDFEFTQSS